MFIKSDNNKIITLTCWLLQIRGTQKEKKKPALSEKKEEGSFDRHINVIQQSSFSPDYRSLCAALYLNIAVIFFIFIIIIIIYLFILFIFFSCWKVRLQPSCCWQIFNWCFWDSFCAFQVWVINYVPLHTDREKYKSLYDYYTYDL